MQCIMLHRHCIALLCHCQTKPFLKQDVNQDLWLFKGRVQLKNKGISMIWSHPPPKITKIWRKKNILLFYYDYEFWAILKYNFFQNVITKFQLCIYDWVNMMHGVTILMLNRQNRKMFDLYEGTDYVYLSIIKILLDILDDDSFTMEFIIYPLNQDADQIL